MVYLAAINKSLRQLSRMQRKLDCKQYQLKYKSSLKSVSENVFSEYFISEY